MQAAAPPARAARDAFAVSHVPRRSLTGPPLDAATSALANEPLARVARGFFTAFPTANVVASSLHVALAPGRVNLIGEHIDYEGYGVLPMAIAQWMGVALAPCSISSTAGLELTIANTDPAHAKARLSVTASTVMGDALFQTLAAQLDASTAWVRYVLCGYMAVVEWRPSLASQLLSVDVLVDGTVPPACGLSSSSALVVASALAFASLLCTNSVPILALPSRTELAERCREAEQYVGTAGGGMDQAVSCLATRDAALHVTFEPQLHVEPVAFPEAFRRAGAVFLVVHSGVQAHKAQDAAVRFNKRVVECALATKLLAKRLGLAEWQHMTTLRELQDALAKARGRAVSCDELLDTLEAIRDQNEFTREALKAELSPPASLVALFAGSRLEKAAQHVLEADTRFRLWQRAHHVWSEAIRVEQFRGLLGQHTNDDVNHLEKLGALMLASHDSCRDDYECSCPELDKIVVVAKKAGAYGARLTGAGWGGCAVLLADGDRIETLRRALAETVFTGDHPHKAMFESTAAGGAELFAVTDSSQLVEQVTESLQVHELGLDLEFDQCELGLRSTNASDRTCL